MTTGAAINHDMKLLLVFGRDEEGAIARTLAWSGRVGAGARTMGAATIDLDCFESKIGIVLGEFVEFAGIEPDAAAGGAAIEGDFERCADTEADGFHHAGVGGAGEFPAVLTRDKGHEVLSAPNGADVGGDDDFSSSLAFDFFDGDAGGDFFEDEAAP